MEAVFPAVESVEKPESLLIVGRGVIGCEFAFLFSSLGSTVTVVEALFRMPPISLPKQRRQ